MPAQLVARRPQPLATAPDDSGEYDALLEVLEELSPKEQLEALQDYLERYPSSPYQSEILWRLDAIRDGIREAEEEQSGSLEKTRLSVPMSFAPPEPMGRAQGELQLGPPGWFRGLVTYTYPIDRDLALGGVLGLAEGTRLLAGSGQLAFVRTPRNEGVLSGTLTLRIELGQDSRLQLEPAAGYGCRLGKLELQAFLGPRIRMTGRFDIRYQAGGGVGFPLDNLWIGLETFGYFKRVMAERSDYPEPFPTWAGFFSVTGGLRYHFTPALAVLTAVSLPAWYRYRKDYNVALTLTGQYRFDRNR